MIFQNDCLFLFNGDIAGPHREYDIHEIDIKAFVRGEPEIDNDMIEKYKKAKIVVYANDKDRLLKYFAGPRKGNIERF